LADAHGLDDDLDVNDARDENLADQMPDVELKVGEMPM
jgi:hypothetical protein